jgi:hypothetical protein
MSNNSSSKTQKRNDNKKQENIKLNIIEIEEEKLIDIPNDNINLCFVGGVSTCKSTILNAIFCEELTQCKIKRTTMVMETKKEVPVLVLLLPLKLHHGSLKSLNSKLPTSTLTTRSSLSLVTSQK